MPLVQICPVVLLQHAVREMKDSGCLAEYTRGPLEQEDFSTSRRPLKQRRQTLLLRTSWIRAPPSPPEGSLVKWQQAGLRSCAATDGKQGLGTPSYGPDSLGRGREDVLLLLPTRSLCRAVRNLDRVVECMSESESSRPTIDEAGLNTGWWPCLVQHRPAPSTV